MPLFLFRLLLKWLPLGLACQRMHSHLLWSRWPMIAKWNLHSCLYDFLPLLVGQRYWNQIMESWLLVAYSDSSWLHPSVSIPSSISITFLIFSRCDHLCPQICVAFCWIPFVLLHNATIILSYYTSLICHFFLQRLIWGGHILQPLYSLIKYIGLWSDIEHVFCLDAAFSTITNFWIEYLESLPFHLPISWLSSCDIC